MSDTSFQVHDLSEIKKYGSPSDLLKRLFVYMLYSVLQTTRMVISTPVYYKKNY
jgi:hypothetical protein